MFWWRELFTLTFWSGGRVQGKGQGQGQGWRTVARGRDMVAHLLRDTPVPHEMSSMLLIKSAHIMPKGPHWGHVEQGLESLPISWPLVPVKCVADIEICDEPPVRVEVVQSRHIVPVACEGREERHFEGAQVAWRGGGAGAQGEHFQGLLAM